MTGEDPAMADHANADGALAHQAAANHEAAEQTLMQLGDRIVSAIGSMRETVDGNESAAVKARRALKVSNVTLLIAVVIFGLLQGYADVTLHQQNKATQDSNKTIQSCVSAEGSCYRRNATSDQGTRSALINAGQMRLAVSNEATIVALACTKDIPDSVSEKQRVAAIEACVKRTMQQLPSPSPSPYPTPSN